jgi:hypothetical protein
MSRHVADRRARVLAFVAEHSGVATVAMLANSGAFDDATEGAIRDDLTALHRAGQVSRSTNTGGAFVYGVSAVAPTSLPDRIVAALAQEPLTVPELVARLGDSRISIGAACSRMFDVGRLARDDGRPHRYRLPPTPSTTRRGNPGRRSPA